MTFWNRHVLLYLIAILMVASNAFAQTWENTHARTLMLPGGGNDFSHVLTMQAGSISASGTFTWPIPSSGILSSDGSGNITIGTLGTSAFTAGGNNTFLITGNTGTVSWSGLNIGATLTGNGIGSALGISGTYPGQTSIITLGTITTGTWHGSVIDITRGGTNGTASPTAGGVAYGDGTQYQFSSAGSSGQVLTSGGTGAPTFTTNLSGITIDNSSIGVTTKSTGGFTTLTSTGATTLATGASLTNTFGTGTAAANTIGNASGTNQINGSTTFGGTLAMGSNQISGSNFSITGGTISGVTISNISGSFTTNTTSPAITATANGTVATSTAISISATNGTGANYAIDVTAGDIRDAGNISTTNGGTIISDGLLTANNGFTLSGGTASFGARNITGSNFTITGTNGSSIAGTPISGSTGSFTTLSSSGTTALGTGSGLTNTFGTGATANNTIGNASGTNAINGTTTFSGTVNAGTAFNATGGTLDAMAITTGSINNTPIGATTKNTGAFTTLTSNGNSTIATGSNLTNSFGTGSTATNTIGNILGTNQINGSTTFGGTVAMGSNQISGSNFSITGGSIDGTTVGATTKSTGAFTTLAATGAFTGTTASFSGSNVTIGTNALSGTKGTLVLKDGVSATSFTATIQPSTAMAANQTFTLPPSMATGNVVYASSATQLSSLATANYGVLNTDASGNPSIAQSVTLDGTADRTIAVNNASGTSAGHALTLQSGNGSTTGAGGAITVKAGTGAAAAGGPATVQGGAANGTDKAAGGATIDAGNSTGTGTSTITFKAAKPAGSTGSGINTSATVATLDGSGNLSLGTASTLSGTIKLANASSANLTSIQAGNATAAVTYTLPTADATSSGQVLSSNGSGALSWTSSVVSIVTGYLTVATGTGNNTYYYNPAGGTSGTNTTQGVQSTTTSTMIVPHACTARNFYIIQSVASGTNNTNDWYIHNRTTNTDGAHVQLGGATTSGSDLSTTLTVNAGDEIEIKRVSAGGPASTGAQWGFELDYP